MENLIERAIVLTQSSVIQVEDLPPFLIGASPERKNAGIEFRDDQDLKEQTQNFQKAAIMNALKKSHGIQKNASELLGIKPTTLNEMIKRLKIDLDRLYD